MGFGYDGLIRKWNNDSEVCKKKGVVLFHKSSVEDVNTAITFRELSRYGMESDCTWTASSNNTMIVTVSTRSNPFIFCFESEKERDEAYSLLV